VGVSGGEKTKENATKGRPFQVITLRPWKG